MGRQFGQFRQDYLSFYNTRYDDAAVTGFGSVGKRRLSGQRGPGRIFAQHMDQDTPISRGVKRLTS